MKTAIFAIVFSAAMMGAAAAAEPAGAGSQNGAAQAYASRSYEPAIGEFDDYERTYVLEDGRRIEFTQRIGTYYVQLQGEKRTELLPQSRGVFLTASGTRIEFRDNGENLSIRNYDKLAIRKKVADGAIVMAKR
jgi:hypothetical protein